MWDKTLKRKQIYFFVFYSTIPNACVLLKKKKKERKKVIGEFSLECVINNNYLQDL